MKGILILLLSVLLCAAGYAQEHLDTDPARVVTTDFKTGLSDVPEITLENFIQKSFPALEAGKKFTVSDAATSYVHIQKPQIGRLVFQVAMYDGKSKELTRQTGPVKGTVEISFHNKKGILSTKTMNLTFEDNAVQQVMVNTESVGVSRIEIKCTAESGVFLLEKLKVYSLSREGMGYYAQREMLEQSISRMMANTDTITTEIRLSYLEHLQEVQETYTYLNQIISGQVFQNIAITQSSALNPFQNGNFMQYYDQLLQKAEESERKRIEELSSSMSGAKFTDMAFMLDNLITGGKLASMIGLVDGLFRQSMQLPGMETALVFINNNYYSQKSLGSDRIRLEPVTDADVLKQIKDVQEQNDAFREYMQVVSGLLQEDMKNMNDLNTYIVEAKFWQQELEDLCWQMVSTRTSAKRDEIIRKSGINFVGITQELQKSFQADMSLDSLNQLQIQSNILLSDIREALNACNEVMGKIKQQYDLIYETNPRVRKDALNSITLLPADLRYSWKDSQDAVVAEYTKEGGLQEFLESAAGK